MVESHDYLNIPLLFFQAGWNVLTWGPKWIKFFRYIYRQFPLSTTFISSFTFLSIAIDRPAGTCTTLYFMNFLSNFWDCVWLVTFWFEQFKLLYCFLRDLTSFDLPYCDFIIYVSFLIHRTWDSKAARHMDHSPVFCSKSWWRPFWYLYYILSSYRSFHLTCKLTLNDFSMLWRLWV